MFLKYLSIFNKNSQHNETTLDNTLDNTLDTSNDTLDTSNDTTIDTTIDTTLEIYSDYYSIIENNNNLIDSLVIMKNPSQSEDFDLSSTNISNEIVSKYS